MPSNLHGLTLSNECFCEYAQVIQVLIDSRKSVKKRNEVLLHEMIHVKQFSKNELQIVGRNRVKWNGRLYLNVNNYHNHEEKPWEKEAIIMTKTLSWLFDVAAETLDEKIIDFVNSERFK